MIENTVQEGRRRLTQVFRFLKALHELRYPPVRQVAQQPFALYLSDIPEHPSVEFGGSETVLRLRRPNLTPHPVLPPNLSGWVAKGWEDPATEPQQIASKSFSYPEEHEEAFDASPERVDSWRLWIDLWRRWSPGARIERQVDRVYQKLYEQYSILERDSERFELLIGDAFLNWRLPEGGVHHPLLLKPVELTFEASKFQFTLVESIRPTEFYSAPLLSREVDGLKLSKLRDQVDGSEVIGPFGGEATNDFLRGMVASFDDKGEFLEEVVSGERDFPRAFRSLVLFRRARTAGMGQAIDTVLQDLLTESSESEELGPTWAVAPPEGLMRVVGLAREDNYASRETNGSILGEAEDDTESYFTKPANVEQYRIVRKLESSGCVLVQGPPGTGKTHTIANLIGHLLAQGKSVLVTSHTAKALTVLGEKVSERLQPLCVSVLDNERRNRNLLEASVQKISDRLSEDIWSDPRRVTAPSEARALSMARVGELKLWLRTALRSEYESIFIDGEDIRPIDAAKEVAKGRGLYDWIPGTVTLGATLPLSWQELFELHESNVTLTPEDEANHPGDFPDLNRFISEGEYARLVSDAQDLRGRDLAIAPSLLVREIEANASVITEAQRLINEAAAFFEGEGSIWKRNLIESVIRGEASYWEDLSRQAAGHIETTLKLQDRQLRVAPRWVDGIDVRETIDLCGEIEAFLAEGKALKGLVLLTRPRWKAVIASLRVADGEPKQIEHFVAGREALDLQRARAEMVRVWNGRMEEINGPSIGDRGNRPERDAQPYLLDIATCLAWVREVLPKLQASIKKAGVAWNGAMLAIPATTGATAQIDRMLASLQDVVLPTLDKLLYRLVLRRVEDELAGYKGNIQATAVQFTAIPYVQILAASIEEENVSLYEESLGKLRAVGEKATPITRRREYLRRLKLHAPDWAAAVAARKGVFGEREAPDGTHDAWRWKQLDGELMRRAKESIQDLVVQLADARQERDRLTSELVEGLAWGKQVQRVTPPMRQSLKGYVQTMRAVGAGTGKRAPVLLAEARKLMEQCQPAVPVWIMPLTRVAESFDLRQTRFDVVIVDEASQLDLNGMLAMYMAKQVVIVGDEEQVEPTGAFQNLDGIQSLIDSHLAGIPNSHLWDGKQSVYKLADASFEAIQLREHFRCVRQIIAFSDRLCYRPLGKSLLPLREDSGVSTRPFVVAYHVAGASTERRRNQREAEALVALMKAASEMPEYLGKTFGAINMVGDDDSDQSRLVNELARVQLGEEELEARKFRCGSSPQFQGDERDVMFLSIVDTPQNGPWPTRATDLFKKRYNVAASRARDQLWVLYSLDPSIDLRSGDLRRELIDFARDPESAERQYDDLLPKTESDFEERVLRYLLDSGYSNIQPQYKVGAYRLDFVVENDGKRAAIECDGERYHGPEKLDEDLARQATLERLGWRFIRIRGSDFYRRPEETMVRVISDLTALGIHPSSEADESREAPPTDLLDRVKRRAEQFLGDWRGEFKTADEEAYYVDAGTAVEIET